MSNVELLNSLHKTARVNKDELAKALFSTMKGEYDTAIKSGKDANDSTLENIAKKMIKSAEIMNTSDSKIEISLLKSFITPELSDEALTAIINNTVVSLEKEVNEYRAGNTNKIGFMIGHIIKNNKNVNPAKVKSILTNLLT